MAEKFKYYVASIGGVDVFSIELLDERPVGFSVCVPELAIYSFGQTEAQAIERVLTHVIEKYEDLLSSPIPLDENEQRFLKLYRTKLIPALFEASLQNPPEGSFWQRLNDLLLGDGRWQKDLLGSLNTCLKPSIG